VVPDPGTRCPFRDWQIRQAHAALADGADPDNRFVRFEDVGDILGATIRVHLTGEPGRYLDGVPRSLGEVVSNQVTQILRVHVRLCLRVHRSCEPARYAQDGRR